MKTLSIAVGVICSLFAFAAQAEKQNKSEVAPQTVSAIETSPAAICTAPGMGTREDAVWVAGECEKREAARFFLAMGQYKSALAIMCSTKAAQGRKGLRRALDGLD